MIKYFLIFLFLVSCSNMPKKPAPEKLFPFGTYHHNISFEVKAKEIAMSFTGINQWTKERFVVVGLGPMDMTMIKYTENKENYTKDLYINKELIPIDEDRALKLMSLMKDMYSWDRSICEDKKCRDTFWGIPINIELNDQYQVSKIMVSQGGVVVNVDVTSYEKAL